MNKRIIIRKKCYDIASRYSNSSMLLYAHTLHLSFRPPQLIEISPSIQSKLHILASYITKKLIRIFFVYISTSPLSKENVLVLILEKTRATWLHSQNGGNCH